MRIAAIAAVLGTAALVQLGTAGAPAHAGPFCATKGGPDGYENCSYASFQSCLESVRGVGGSCNVNPRFAEGPRDYPGPHRRGHSDYR